MDVQEKVAQYVQNFGIKQSFISEKTGLSPAKVSMILNKNQKMTADELVLFCRALQKNPNDFVDLEDL